MEEMELSQFSIRGQSNVHCLIPGYRFTVTRHPNADGTYVAGSVTHSAVEGDFHSGDKTVESHYSNTFTCFPVALRYHPARTTAKAHVWGCQTAVVVGPAGEEIYTDDKARVKVQFHWDREGKNDAASSCWIRVASHWAGQGWGAIHLPRIGQEVVVDFLEGDPDCPLIVGSVYNAVKMPPYSLPDNKTQSGITVAQLEGWRRRQLQRDPLRGQKGQRRDPDPCGKGPDHRSGARRNPHRPAQPHHQHPERRDGHHPGQAQALRGGRGAGPDGRRSWAPTHLPRIVQEVVVDFLEGDPDCPLVVGSVYNADMTPPYDLPANKTQSGITSRSRKGGGAANYNEIIFEDKKGSEVILLHAEKDLTTEVDHDETRTVAARPHHEHPERRDRHHPGQAQALRGGRGSKYRRTAICT